MTRLRLGPLAACVALVLAAGCTNDPRAREDFALMQSLAERARAQGTGAAVAPAASEPAEVRALLAQLPPGPVIRLELPASGQSAFALLAGRTGETVTFATVTGQSLTFRGGALVATRGFVYDLMGVDMPPVESAVAQRTASRHVRSHRTLAFDDREVATPFDCVLAREASEIVTLVSGESFATTRMRETCAGAGNGFENVYWVTGEGIVMRMDQWVTPELGTMRIEVLPR